MQATKQSAYPWYRTRTVIVTLDTGEKMTGFPVEVNTIADDAKGDRQLNFRFHEAMSCNVSAVARAGRVAEVEFQGKRYRALKYFNLANQGTQVVTENIGPVPIAANKPPVQELILSALRSSLGGMTAHRIAEELGCSRSWVFSALAALVKAGRISKNDGGLYRLVE